LEGNLNFLAKSTGFPVLRAADGRPADFAEKGSLVHEVFERDVQSLYCLIRQAPELNGRKRPVPLSTTTRSRSSDRDNPATGTIREKSTEALP
jgi:hypothetical protein